LWATPTKAPITACFADLVRAKVKAIVCLGTDNSKIIEAFAPIVKTIVETRSFADAVQAAAPQKKNEPSSI
jgi:UDP-N-acetylmuramoylalanine--D-glutamate ligase